jgi:hypothetical protein
MLKLPISLLVLLSALVATCTAQDVHPLAQLQGSSRVLIVFAPDSNSANFKRQLQLIERHAYELTERNTVVVPASYASAGTDDHFTGENLPFGSSSEQEVARNRFHVKPGEFLVVLLSQDGTEQIRSVSPVDIHELTAKLDAMPKR